MIMHIGAPTLGALTLMTYNAGGNGSTDWSTNAPQVQAIGRQVLFLQPDISRRVKGRR